jgi:hypothetical protein
MYLYERWLASPQVVTTRLSRLSVPLSSDTRYTLVVGESKCSRSYEGRTQPLRAPAYYNQSLPSLETRLVSPVEHAAIDLPADVRPQECK